MQRGIMFVVATLAGLAALPQLAQAQARTTCQGRVVVDTIYQTGTGGNNFEYFIHLRNATRGSLTVDVTFSGFAGVSPSVTLFSASLPGIPIGANATISSLRFGRGNNGQINTGTVARVYDVAPGSGPTVRLTNCRPA
ncbi:MAG: hypothetical protein NTW56_20620 [Alphaproteobacteria bacterium]|nr:hypothetical protein [Alphaproteobacteria bacterium]